MIVLLMGVSGSGKTTVGSLLAREMHWKFADADDYHSAANKGKMHAGTPLNDADRAPWLEELRRHILGWIEKKQNVVLACSALKEAYRNSLLVSPEVKLVFLYGSYALIHSRIESRTRHFMNPELLKDQFETLELPKDALDVDVNKSPEQIANEIRKGLGI